ncbi:MAG: diguanylate cyclase [Sideroxyarcus sp.]|nr:diguanylate cyclase [Sideroxyarcus sp.]
MNQPASIFETSVTHASRWRQLLTLTASRTMRQLVLLGAVLLLLIWSAVIWEVDRIKKERLADFRQNLMHLTEVLDETLVRQLHGIDNALLILRNEYIDDKTNLMRTISLLRHGPLKGLDVQVTVVGRDGYPEMTDVPGNPTSVYLGDRPYFRLFAEGGPDQLYISEPVLGRLTKRRGMQLARPILASDGKFLGIVVIFLPPDLLTRFIKPLEIGTDTIMSVISPSGALLSRSKDIEKFLDTRISPEQLAEYQQNRSGFALRRSVLDQVERGLAHRWISAYPLLLVVSRTPDTVYTEISTQQQLLLFFGSGASLLVLASLTLLGRSWRLREEGERLLQREHTNLVGAQRIAQLGSWELDLASGRLYWSDEVFRIFEIDKNQFPASYDAFLNAIHPDDREAVNHNYTYSLEKREPYNIVHRLRMSDGRIKWVRERCTSNFEANGKPLRSSGTVQDITTDRGNEIELRIAATAFESQEGMFVTDENGVILRINNAFTDITGYTAADVVGKNPRIRSSGRHDAAFYAAMWERIKSTGAWKGELWNRHKNGEVYPESISITAVMGVDDTVTHYVATMHDISERKASEEQIHNLAFYDPLTQLPNRRLLQDRLQQALVTSSRSKNHGALMFMDLDKFKTLNDTMGHDIGDLLLQQVAQRLLSCVREADTVARLGGDEFVVLLEELSEQGAQASTQAGNVGQKILDALNQPYHLGEHEHHSTPSIGATLFRGQQETAEELIKQADLAMYQVKAAGRNALRFFEPAMRTSDTDPQKD